MTAELEHLTCPDCGEEHDPSEMKVMQFCDSHLSILDAFAHQRSLTDSMKGEVINSMLVGVVTTMGPAVFDVHNGCPVCVLEGTLERACDDVSIRRRKAN